MKKLVTRFAFLWQALLIAGVVFFSLNPVACKMTEEGLRFLHGDFSPPTLESFLQVDAESVKLEFSKKVNIRNVVIAEHNEAVDFFEKKVITRPNVNVLENESSVMIFLQEKLAPGVSYELYGEVLDGGGSSLTFCVPIVGFNENIPSVFVSAIHPVYASPSGAKNLAKCEFVELTVQEDGNLAGVKIKSATYGDNFAFTFPSLDVSRGEKIVVYMRAKGDGCVSEWQNDLSLCSGWYSSNSVREVWMQNEKKCMGDKQDVIIIENSFTKKIIDGVPFKQDVNADWQKDELRTAYNKLVEDGIWEEEECALAEGLTATKILQRDVSSAVVSTGGKNASGGDNLQKVRTQKASDWSVQKVSWK